MKEREQPPTPADPRAAAKDFIRQQVRAGATLASLLQRHPSRWDERYSATVGGTIFNHREGRLHFQALGIDQVGVWKLGGEQCWGVFALHEIYEEIWREEHPDEDAPGELMQQGKLL